MILSDGSAWRWMMLLGKAEQLLFKPEKRDFILLPCVDPVCINLSLMSPLVCTALCETEAELTSDLQSI